MTNKSNVILTVLQCELFTTICSVYGCYTLDWNKVWFFIIYKVCCCSSGSFVDNCVVVYFYDYNFDVICRYYCDYIFDVI
jgi:hypothetical protein